MPKYYSFNARLESFAIPQRSKVSPKSKAEYSWPHPTTFRANPESLAHAGFYYCPSSTNPDAVTCFMCNKGLADWDPEDDPAKIHAEKCPTCPWAILACTKDTSKNGSFKFSASRLPTSRHMEEARLETFGVHEKWWPHDGKNTGPSSKSMARAGFIYRPAHYRDDTCVCLYCGVELAGWDPNDDPIEEHRSRQAKKGACPFFDVPAKATAAAKPAKAKPRAPPKPAVSEKTSPEALSSDAEYQPPTTRQSSTKSTTRSRKSQPAPNGTSGNSKAKEASSSKTSKKPGKGSKGRTLEQEVVAEYQVVLNEECEPRKSRPTKAAARRASTRSRSASRSKSRASSSNTTATKETDLATAATSPSTGEKISPMSGDSKELELEEASKESLLPPVIKPKKTRSSKAVAKKKTVKRPGSQQSNASSSRVTTDRDEEIKEDGAVAEEVEVEAQVVMPSKPLTEQSASGRSEKGSKIVEVLIESKKSSFQPPPPSQIYPSPADEELAREEEALEEQARALMLADPTLSLTPSTSRSSKRDPRSGIGQPLSKPIMMAPTLASSHGPGPDNPPPPPALLPTITLENKGKSKAPPPPQEVNTVIETDRSTPKPPSTPPPRHFLPVSSSKCVRSPAADEPLAEPSLQPPPPPLLTQTAIVSLTEEERLMTVEQWIRHEMERQYELLKSDGRRKIEAFKERAVEIAGRIENL